MIGLQSYILGSGGVPVAASVLQAAEWSKRWPCRRFLWSTPADWLDDDDGYEQDPDAAE